MKAKVGRTVIVIAHRPSTLTIADVVMCVYEGPLSAKPISDWVEQFPEEDPVVKFLNSEDDADIVTEVSIDREQEWDGVQEEDEDEDTPLLQHGEEKSESSEGKFATLWRLMKPERTLLVAGVIVSVVSALCHPFHVYWVGLVFALLRDRCIDGVPDLYGCTDYNAAMIPYLRALYIQAGVFFVVFAFRHYFLQWAADLFTDRCKVDLFKAYNRRSCLFFDNPNHSAGALATRLHSDVTGVADLIANAIGEIAQVISLLFITVAITIVYGTWRYAIVVAPCMIVLGLLQTLSIKAMAGSQKKLRLLNERIGTIQAEALGNIRTVKAYAMEKVVQDKFETELMAFRKMGVTQAHIAGGSLGLFFIASCAMVAGYFSVGDYLVRSGLMDFSHMIIVIMVADGTSAALANRLHHVGDMSKGFLCAEQIQEDLELPDEIDRQSGMVPRHSRGGLQLQRLTFAYPLRPERAILREIDLTIPPGCSVALVGRSGQGKSTLIQLLERFYAPQKGRILFDGQDICSLNLNWYRRQIALVEQEPKLLDMSIRDNIAFGKPDGATIEEVEEAARLAHAHDFIVRLPQGYDTVVGASTGGQLSGGQKQRIAIARALVRKPAVLVLDEPTSALDADSEAAVVRALQQVKVGRTVIMICHRPCSLKVCDAVLNLCNGNLTLKANTKSSRE
jgi:ATP-binding cassette subfamily B (MDR/TAP) protein 1